MMFGIRKRDIAVGLAATAIFVVFAILSGLWVGALGDAVRGTWAEYLIYPSVGVFVLGVMLGWHFLVQWIDDWLEHRDGG